MSARPALLRALSLGVGTLAALLLGEAAVRLASARLLNLSNPLARFDPQLGWVQQDGPAVLRVNEAHEEIAIQGHALGIREPPGSLPARDARPMLVVGDSFTAGNQVRYEDTWPARLASGSGVAVVNAGVDGYDLAQEYRLAERLWPRFEPRLLVVGLFVGNDLVDYEHAAQARPPWQPASPVTWLREHSYLFDFVSGGVRGSEARTGRRRADADPELLPDWDPRTLPGMRDLNSEQQGRLRGQFAAPELLPVLRGSAEGDLRLAATRRMLEALAELARTHCAGFTLVLIPAKPQAIPAQRSVWLRLHRLTDEAADRPQRELRRWAAGTGVDAVDVAPAIAASAEPETLFWRIDQHLSPAGHALVATVVAPTVAHDLAAARACAE